MHLLVTLWVANPSGCAPAPAAPSREAELDALRADLDLLISEVDTLRGAVVACAPDDDADVAPTREQVCAGNELFDAVQASPLAGWGRIMAHQGADGAHDGYRLSAIRADSPLAMLGLRNGDIVHAVNGISVLSDDMNDLYGELTREGLPTEITLTVTRSGRPVELVVSANCTL